MCCSCVVRVLFVCCLCVVCVLFVCCLCVVCVLFVCCLCVVCVLFVCCLCVVCVLFVCCLCVHCACVLLMWCVQLRSRRGPVCTQRFLQVCSLRFLSGGQRGRLHACLQTGRQDETGRQDVICQCRQDPIYLYQWQTGLNLPISDRTPDEVGFATVFQTVRAGGRAVSVTCRDGLSDDKLQAPVFVTLASCLVAFQVL